MRIFYVIALMSVFLLGNLQAQGSKSQTRMIGPFSKLIVNSSLSITIIPNGEEKVVLYTEDPAFASFININSNGSDLIIEVKNKPKNMSAVATATIYCKSLSHISINKPCDISFASKLSANKLRIELNNKSKITNALLDVGNLYIQAKGASMAILSIENNSNLEIVAKAKSAITLNGNTQKLHIDATNNSIVDAALLQASKISVDCNDNSVVTILCNDKFDANVNNNSKVEVKGTGKLNKKNIKNGGSVVQL
ncbi:MAG: GIN domain-containing protein [Chitinophagaceae bacterium]